MIVAEHLISGLLPEIKSGRSPGFLLLRNYRFSVVGAIPAWGRVRWR
jgi:hypothetical protein